MSQLFRHAFNIMSRRERMTEILLKIYHLQTANIRKKLFLINERGYARMYCTNRSNFCKINCLIESNIDGRYQLLEKILSRDNGNNGKGKKFKDYENLAFVLSGLGLVIAFCKVADINKEKRFFRAAQYGNIPDLKKALADGIDVNARHPLGWTALQCAAINGKTEAVTFLLENGADPNAGDEFVNVYKTAMERGLHSLDVLVKREDEFSDRLNNKATFKGFTALHYAVLADSIGCIGALLDGGANPTIENESGHRAIEYTRDPEIKEILTERALKYDEIMKEKVLDLSLI